MQEIKVNVYSLNELDEWARNKAHNDYLEGLYIDASEFRDTIEAFENVFPIKRVGDFFNPSYEDNVGEFMGARLMAYIWNNYKSALFKGKYYQVKNNEKVTHRRVKAKQCRNGWFNAYYSAITLENSCPLTGMCYDNTMLQPVYDALEGKFNGTFDDMLRACYTEIDAAWEQECDYRQSYAAFEEDSEGKLFFKDGRVYE